MNMTTTEPQWMQQAREKAESDVMTLPMPKEDKRTSFHLVNLEGVQLGKAKLTRSSTGGATVLKMEDAMDNALFRKHFNTTIIEGNKFSTFNTARWKQGTFVHVPKGAKATVRVNRTGKAARATRTLVVVDALAKATIMEESSGDTPFSSEVVEIIIGEGASVRYANVQNVGNKTLNLVTRRALLAKDARLFWAEGCFGSRLTAADIRSTMKGSGAATQVYTAFFGRDDQQFDLRNVSIHAAPDTTSMMLAKGALNDHAKQVYRGLIRIEANAARSNGQQREDTLMLSDGAESDPIPMLEIANNDVRCSHAATITHVDNAKTFYMQSRGIDQETAEKMAVEAFFAPFCSRLPEAAARECMKQVRARL